MNHSIPRDWLRPPNLQEASQIQRMLSAKISLTDTPLPFKTIGGMDVSNSPRDKTGMLYAVAVVLDALSLQVVAVATHYEIPPFPYRTGFLAFREAPSLIHAYEKLPIKPDVLLVDGHGISHPRKLGIASHIGVLLDKPTIGVGKSLLVGKVLPPIGLTPGDVSSLIWHDEEIGKVVRSKKNANPLIISCGHKISLEKSVETVLKCLNGYRLPEPTRLAHNLANQLRVNGGSLNPMDQEAFTL